MNPNKTRNIIIALFLFFLVCAFAYLFFLSNSRVNLLEKHNKRLTFQRDSTNEANIKISQGKQQELLKFVDSIKVYIKTLEIKDSTLFYENKHKKGGFNKLTPIQRNAKLDSLLRSR
jgi:hypothetical protein